MRNRVIISTPRVIVRVPGPQGVEGPPAPNTNWDALPGKPATFPPTIGAASNQAVAGNDPRLGDSRTPTGEAGGVLAGNFPNPGFATAMATAAAVVAAEESAKEYADTQIAALASTTFRDRGLLNCSTSPNYPVAVARDIWTISHAGKIGGVNGPAVEVGDTLVASVNSVAGDHASVGANFRIGQTNIPGLSAIGVALATLATPVGPRYIRVNADGSVSVLTFGELKTALALEKADVGLGNVTNTSDADKPVSTLQADAIGGKQDTLPAGGALQVLRRNAANDALEFATPSAGGIAIDEPPVAPSAWDDEFASAATLPGGASPKWSWKSSLGYAGATLVHSASIVGGCAVLRGLTGATANKGDVMRMTTPISDTVAWEYTVKLWLATHAYTDPVPAMVGITAERLRFDGIHSMGGSALGAVIKHTATSLSTAPAMVVGEYFGGNNSNSDISLFNGASNGGSTSSAGLKKSTGFSPVWLRATYNPANRVGMIFAMSEDGVVFRTVAGQNFPRINPFGVRDNGVGGEFEGEKTGPIYLGIAHTPGPDAANNNHNAVVAWTRVKLL